MEKGIKVYIVRVDDTCHSCTSGNFLGGSEDQIDQAGFIKLKLSMNCMPPPHETLLQDNFEANATELAEQILAVHGADIGIVVESPPPPAAAAAATSTDHQVLNFDEPEPEPAPAAAAPSPAVPPVGGAKRTVADWLQEASLAMCEASLAEASYDAELQMVIEGDEEEVADMIEAVGAVEGIKKPTVKKFKRELAKVRGKGETFA